MIVKIISLALVGLLILAMLGSWRAKAGEERGPRGLGRRRRAQGSAAKIPTAVKCPRCGAYRVDAKTCPCGAAG